VMHPDPMPFAQRLDHRPARRHLPRPLPLAHRHRRPARLGPSPGRGYSYAAIQGDPTALRELAAALTAAADEAEEAVEAEPVVGVAS
jgi:hypothetical protein